MGGGAHPPHGEELAGFTQALLPLSSGLTPPRGGHLTTPGVTHSLCQLWWPSQSPPGLTHTHSGKLGSLLRPNLLSAPGGTPLGSDGAAYSHQVDYGPLEAEYRL